jgi:hypothetical protein
MVQYWEAVSCGHVLPGSQGEQQGLEGSMQGDVAGLEAGELEALGAAVPLADLLAARLEAAVESAAQAAALAPAGVLEDPASPLATGPSEEARPQPTAEEGRAKAGPAVDNGVAVPEVTPPHGAQDLSSHPLETPFTIIAASWTPLSAGAGSGGPCATPSPAATPIASPSKLPAGVTATPAASVGEASATPARLTPVNFAAPVPSTPHSTPAADSTSSSLGVTPLSLTALRRAGASEGGSDRFCARFDSWQRREGSL